MKNLILACFCIFSFEEAFSQSQTGYKDTDREQELRRDIKDEVVRGESSTQRRVKPPGSTRKVQKSDSIDGVNCTDQLGNTFAPNSMGYKKCVDKANRIQ